MIHKDGIARAGRYAASSAESVAIGEFGLLPVFRSLPAAVV